ncbi:unnamed protein product [Sympodiomycopsis kandeliae]
MQEVGGEASDGADIKPPNTSAEDAIPSSATDLDTPAVVGEEPPMSIDHPVSLQNDIKETVPQTQAETKDSSNSSQDSLSYSPVFSLLGHSRSISALAFSPDGELLASASADKKIKIWSVKTGSLLNTLRGHHGGISDVVWSPCSRYVVSGSDDRTVGVWNARSGYDLRHLVGHTSYVLCVAVSPQSNLIVSGSFDETVRLWDVRKGTCHREISAHSEAVTDVDFNHDGTLIASCSYDGLIRLWDVPTGLCLATLPHPTSSPTTSIRFSPSSSHLLASSLDSTIRLWDVVNGKVVKTYRSDKLNGKSYQNNKIAIKSHYVIRNKQVYIVSGSEDCKVYFWHLQSRRIPDQGGVLTGHRDIVGAVAVHPTKPIIASASFEHDPSIKLYLDPTGLQGQ